MTDQAVQRIAREADLPAEVLQAALEWQILLWSGEADQHQYDDLAAWRAADPRHEQAWLYVQRLDSRLAGVSDSAAAHSLRAAEGATGRRKFLLALAALVGTGIAARSAYRTDIVQGHLADLRTATGEIREWTLDDGSRITLNTASAVDVDFTDDERRLDLVTGEVLVTTDTDSASPARPVVVTTADGTIHPRGTRFTVRRTGTDTEVAVLSGAVDLRPRSATGRSVRIEAGDRGRVTSERAEQRGTASAPAAWRDGQLVVQQARLADVVAELARYRRGIVRCDPAVADLKVSGTFPVDDTERAFDALAAALPIRLSRVTRYWVTVAPQ